MYLVCPSVCEWKAVNNIVWISNILFSSFVISAAKYGLLSNIMLSNNPCSFYTLFLSNIVNLSTDVLFIIATKYTILNSLSYTTKIVSFTGSFVIKSIVKCIYDFSEISFVINFSTSISVIFFILWHRSQLFIYFLISLVTSGHQ